MSSDNQPAKKQRPSTLPFDPGDMLSVRVRPADLARMWQVSKQAVSQWIKRGVISTYPDGSIDPKSAMKEYLTNTDGSRMRANFMRTISTEVDDLKQINQNLARQLADTHAALQSALAMLAEQSAWLERFYYLVEDGDKLRGASVENWPDCVQELFDAAGEHALAIDPATALPRLDETLAAHWHLT